MINSFKQIFSKNNKIQSYRQLNDEEILTQFMQENRFVIENNFSLDLSFIYNILKDLLCQGWVKIKEDRDIVEYVSGYQASWCGYYPLYNEKLRYFYTIFFDEKKEMELKND